MNDNKYRLEILNANYWEHVKFEKELAQIFGAAHPKRIILANAANEILKSIKTVK